MMEIQGRHNTALCFANVIDYAAIDQIRRMCDQEFLSGSKIRIMPDVHAGKGCTIGTTMTVHDKAVPNIVGVDIGCGMYTVNLGKQELDFRALDEACHAVPSGRSVWPRRLEAFDLTRLRCYSALREQERLQCSLGTLGGGNHFIEADAAPDGTQYLVIHTGSRSLGTQVAQYYQNKAVELHRGEWNRKRAQMIAEYKASGRAGQIQAALGTFAKENSDVLPEELCYLYGAPFEDYLHDVHICQEFARRSRELIAQQILDRCGLTGTDGFHTVHNYIDTDEMILRKGAIAAHAGERVLIPINMRDGSILAVGRGNEDWNYSAPHGAGRLLSRSGAKEQLRMEDYRAAMEGIYTTCVSERTLDESPMAYKSIEDIIDVVAESVDIIDVLKPVYNFKAPD